MKLNYTQTGDYLIPNLIPDEQPTTQPGKYGMLRKTYLKQHRGGTYQALLMSGKLNQHLMEIDQEANRQIELLMKQFLKEKPAPDKSLDQMGWIQHRNELQQTAEEIVLNDLVYR